MQITAYSVLDLNQDIAGNCLGESCPVGLSCP